MTSRPYRLRVPDAVVALIRSLHPQLKREVRAALQAIQENPAIAGRALREELAGLQSVRVRRWRIIYRIVSEYDIAIVAIGPRRQIYEETYNLINKESEAP
jgi:mRNA-degrading endonuclease RelE of RelBE toxin-antitoxin system